MGHSWKYRLAMGIHEKIMWLFVIFALGVVLNLDGRYQIEQSCLHPKRNDVKQNSNL